MISNYNNSVLKNIKSLKELEYQRKILSSRIEQQELIISYKAKILKDSFSPFNFMYQGLESLSHKYSTFGFILKGIDLIRSIKFNKK